MRLCAPSFVPLPRLPLLASSLVPGASLGQDAPPGLRQGDCLNVTNTTPDGGRHYAVVCDAAGQREGWVSAQAIRLLEPAEAAAVNETCRLPVKGLLRCVAFVSADEDWQDPSNPSTLGLRAGQVLQLGAVKGGWAYGWPPEDPSHRGWFPLALVHKVDSCLSSLLRKEEEELPPSASAALVELLKSTPPPPPQQLDWEGELPAAVAESALRAEREWQENVDAMEAQQAAAEAAAEQDAGQEENHSRDGFNAPPSIFTMEQAPDDSHPLVVCKTAFAPPRGSSESLLQLRVGDLIRVTSLLDAAMYYGFYDSNPSRRGWFPQRHVHLVEDPLRPHTDGLLSQMGPPPLPKVPPGLLQKRRGP